MCYITFELYSPTCSTSRIEHIFWFALAMFGTGFEIRCSFLSISNLFGMTNQIRRVPASIWVSNLCSKFRVELAITNLFNIANWTHFLVRSGHVRDWLRNSLQLPVHFEFVRDDESDSAWWISCLIRVCSGRKIASALRISFVTHIHVDFALQTLAWTMSFRLATFFHYYYFFLILLWYTN